MDKLKLLINPELSFFQGYNTAASEMFIRGQLEATLEVFLFKILDHSVTPQDVIAAAYEEGINPIEYVTQETVDRMESEINAFLTVDRGFWKSDSVPSQIERKLREGFWDSLSHCIDYKNSQVFAVGPNVPYINIGPGFTYVLYEKEMTHCLVLVGNTTD